VSDVSTHISRLKKSGRVLVVDDDADFVE